MICKVVGVSHRSKNDITRSRLKSLVSHTKQKEYVYDVKDTKRGKGGGKTEKGKEKGKGEGEICTGLTDLQTSTGFR